MLASGQGATILVVEDDPNMQVLTTLQLEAQGYQTVVKSDGPSALSWLVKARKRPSGDQVSVGTHTQSERVLYSVNCCNWRRCKSLLTVSVSITPTSLAKL